MNAVRSLVRARRRSHDGAIAPRRPMVRRGARAVSPASIVRRAGVNPGDLFDSIRAGDRVQIVDRFGQAHTGRAVMKNREQELWVLNMGGKYGTPGLATRDNVIAVHGARPAQNPSVSERVFEQFNGHPSSKTLKLDLDDGVPFVRIGPVPVIHYLSEKEGKGEREYFHEPEMMPVLYYHPTKPIGVLVGGSMKVRDWFYG